MMIKMKIKIKINKNKDEWTSSSIGNCHNCTGEKDLLVIIVIIEIFIKGKPCQYYKNFYEYCYCYQ